MLALVLVVSGARAEPVFSFDATPGKLPKTVVPISYSIELRPDAESLALPGVEVIDIEVREPTARLTLNAVSIDVCFRRLWTTGRSARDDRARWRGRDGNVDLRATARGGRASAADRASPARINKFDRGFFFVDYPTDSGVKRLLTSKLEPADARRIFPCWDEPAFKATFALTVTVPRTFLAVGNMPVAREEPLKPDAEARRIRADAENVDLSVRADGGRTGAA